MDKQGKRAAQQKRRYYLSHRDEYYRSNKVRRDRVRRYIRLLKRAPCMDCKKSYPWYVMDFDHRDPAKKVDDIAKMVLNCSWDKLIKELEKCDLVCANCHRVRTHGGKPSKV